MGKLNKKEMPMWAKTGHSRPVTRREFLAHGIIPFATYTLLPGAVGFLTSSFASAAECAASAGALPSFVTINLQGGAGLASNFIPRDAGGQLLTSYGKLGGGTSANISLAPDFNLGAMQPFASASPLLAGIKTGAPTALTTTSVAAICVQSRDDSAENTFDASGMVYKAGLVGSMLPNMGNISTPTGISQKASTVSPPPPLLVRNVNDVANSIGYTAAIGRLSADQKQKVSRLVASLSGSQAQKLLTDSSTAQVANLVECAGIKNTQLIQQGSTAIDPTTQAPTMAAVWAVTAGTNKSNQDYVHATMIYNSLVGNGGTVSLQLGGYDYHDGSRTTGDAADNRAGVLIGRILESAKMMNKKIFIYVTSDGAVTSQDSANPGAPWVSDRGSAGLALMFMFDPAVRPVLNGLQVGHFTSGQVADEKTFVGNDPANAAQAAFANYMSFSRRMDLFQKVIPASAALSGATLQGVLKI